MSILGFLAYEILRIYSFCVIIYVIFSMLISFNIVNESNRLIGLIMDSLYRIVEPILRKIRDFIPIFGTIDLSPIFLLIIVRTLQYAILKYDV